MIHPYEQIAEVKAAIDDLSAGLLWVQKHAEQAHRFAREVEAIAVRLTSPFEKLVLHDRTCTYFQKVGKEIVDWAERGQKDHMLISTELPRRGWYMSGREPCTLSGRLVKAVREDEWEQVDQLLMDQLPQFEVDTLRDWLAQENVPDYCINRMCRFLKHHDDGNYEEATYLGVPLLDEIAKHLYGGKTFTTKRSNRRGANQTKPELAFKTACGQDLVRYCESFVQTFGSLQEDPKTEFLADENYWNRHAIVHGLMQRGMGIKDSAKCLMAINFLFFARVEIETTNADGRKLDSTR